ncbi:MAG: amidohydrolase [Clostridiales bacterium]|nr:amidohydrolase [Clostridiales bacterium]
MEILIKNALILTMMEKPGGGLEPPFRGDMVIREDRIAYAGPEAPPGAFDKVISGEKRLVMPGLINAHGHAAMSLFRGYADDMDLMSWLKKKIWPIEAKLRPQDVYHGACLAMLEMIKSGTTAFADMYFHMERVAQAAVEAGLRASLCEGLTSLPGERDKLPLAVDFALNWRGQGGGLITAMLGPHAPYTCPPLYLEKVLKQAALHDLPLHIHLAETKEEVAQILEAYGRRPARLMAEIGLFDAPHVLAAHGVFIAEEEMPLLASGKVSVAHNPRSNMKLASGIAPVSGLLQAGVNVALGTDSACSNNNLDMFQELRAAALLAKLKDSDPKALPAAQALKLATVNGAQALALPDVGTLSPGMKADMILLDLGKPHFAPDPQRDIISHLVYAASGADVETVIVNGRLLMENRRLPHLDEEKILYEAKESMDFLCG